MIDSDNFTELCDAMMMELQRTDNEKAAPSQSILGIMKNFIDSVNEMDETVLIPSRLMDIQMDTTSPPMLESYSNGDGGDMTTSVIPTSLNGSSKPMSGEQMSLHTYYSMLKAVKRELARGPMKEEEVYAEDDDSATAESARLQAVTARAFREHLRGLFSILTHLTNVSKHLTNIYQEETGDQQSCLKPKTFTV